MPKKPKATQAVRAYMAALGKRSAAKRTPEDQANAARAAWATMTPAERSAEMKRRAKVRAKNRKAK